MSETDAEIVNAYLSEDERNVILIEKQSDGSRTKRRHRAEYVTWHKRDDIADSGIRQLKGLRDVVSVAETKDGWLRVGWRDKWRRRDGLTLMRENEVPTFEGDLDPVALFLVETKQKIAKPRSCFLDLEADSAIPLSRKEDMTILSYAVVDRETGEVFKGILEADTAEAEENLLTDLVGVLDDYDQIITWEGDWKGGEFDSALLPARCRKRGIDFRAQDWLWLNQLAIWKKMNMQTAESGAEKESFKLEDIAHEQIGKGKEKPPALVIERFGDKKVARGLGAMTRELYDAGPKFREILLSYNVRDAVILRELEQKKGFLVVFEALCALCGLIPNTYALMPTKQMDGFVLRLGREKGLRFPTKVFVDKDEADDTKYRGAFVYPPRSVKSKTWSEEQARNWLRQHGFKNGIVRNVHVCDFKSLYPSVMRTWNLSADVIVGVLGEGMPIPDNSCRSPGNDLLTRTDTTGIIPFALGELLRLRKFWSDKKAQYAPGTPEWLDANAISNAYKVAANSFYGAGGSPGSRFYNVSVSEATTQNSVWLIKLVMKLAEHRGWVAVYGDTDSMFIIGPSEEAFAKFVRWLNEKVFPVEVAKFGCAENHIKLSFEKTFDRVVFTGSKFYVANYLAYEGKRATAESEPEIKGMAWKRGDRGRLARELQGRIIDCLVGGLKMKQPDGTKIWINHDAVLRKVDDELVFVPMQDAKPEDQPIPRQTEDLDVYRAIISHYRDRVMAGVMPLEDVRFSQSLSKSLREYEKDASEAHVRVARMLLARGQLASKGMRIEYVVVDASKTPQMVIPAEDYAGEFDRFHLWEKVYTPTHDLLSASFPDVDWDEYAAKRPKRAKAGRKTVPAEQLGLLLGRPSKSDDDIGALAVSAYSSRPLIVSIPRGCNAAAVLNALTSVFARYPGAIEVDVHISGDAMTPPAVLASGFLVSPGEAFKDAVADILDEAAKAVLNASSEQDAPSSRNEEAKGRSAEN